MQVVQRPSKGSSILPLLAVATFGLHVLSLLLVLFHGSLLQALEQQLTPNSLVQLLDGRAITADAQPNYQRHPETIRRFVGETMGLMLNWSKKQPPRLIWQVAQPLLGNKLIELVVTDFNAATQANINQGAEYVLVIEKISQPREIAKGKWELEIFAHQLNFSNSNNIGTSTPFNKKLLLRAVDRGINQPPANAHPLQIAVYRLAEARLEISGMCDVNVSNCPVN